jgi:hypothetical protein
VPSTILSYSIVADSSEATGLKWQTPAAAGFVGTSLYKSTDQNVVTATWTALTWDTEFFDTDTFHSTSSNTSRITIPSGKGGKYSLTFSLETEANGTGIRLSEFYKNGTSWKVMSNVTPSAAHNNTQLGTFVIDLVATDYIEVFVYQTSGGNRPYYGTDKRCNFSAVYLGA